MIDGGSGVQAYLRSVYENQRRTAEIKRAYSFREQDQVSVYTLPKGQVKGKFGSFTYKPLSGKAKRLQQNVYTLKGKITKLEQTAFSDKEKWRELRYLRCQLKYMNCKLSAEMCSMPAVGVIVLEAEE